MIRNLKTIVFLAILCLIAAFELNAGAVLPYHDPQATISMDFQDASVKDILKILSVQSGLNFIASEGLQNRLITLYLDKISVKEAMDKLFKANNLTFELAEDSNIFIVKDLGKPQVETVTKVFYLKYATVSSSSLKEEMANNMKSASTGSTESSSSGESSASSGGKWAAEEDTGITKAIKKLISEYGSVAEDFRTNSLIVTDTANRMAVITQTILALDIAVPQVMLEVEMLDVSKNLVDAIGIKYGQSPLTLNMLIQGATRTTNFPWGSILGLQKSFTSRGSFGVNTGATATSIAPPSTYQIVLDYLSTRTDTKFLARPRLLTLNNETAEIKITTQESVGVDTTTEGSTSTTNAKAERAETGVSLRITPQINLETDEITMFIYPRVGEAAAGNTITSNGAAYQYRDPEERSTKTMVRIKDGETVIVGGLIRKDKTEVITKLPILGDIPLLGALFRHKNKSRDRDRELLVFITPRIIRDSHTGMKLTQAKKAAFPDREQNTVSVVDREAVIARSLNNFEDKK
ncbi:MAG: secretin N-terminal domain-containing protein [Candidatus Omnitrophota bacterium]